MMNADPRGRRGHDRRGLRRERGARRVRHAALPRRSRRMSRLVEIVDTTTRDGNQSLWSATGLTTPDVLAIAPTIDRVGFHAADFSVEHAHGRLGPLPPGGPVGAVPARERRDAEHAAQLHHHRHALHLLGPGRRGGDAALVPLRRPQRDPPLPARRPLERPRAPAAAGRDGAAGGRRGGRDRAHLLGQRGAHARVLRRAGRRARRTAPRWTGST